MKFISVFMILIVIQSNAQIPNSGFENWKTVGNFYEPTSWYSFFSLMDSSGSYCPVTRSTDHYPYSVGNYSVRIANDTAIWNTGVIPNCFLGWGVLISTKSNDKPLFPIVGRPHSLCGYYKFLPDNGDTMNIIIHLYKNGIEITNGHLQSDVYTSEWEAFQIIFSDTSYMSVDSARILFSAANEPKDGSKGPLGNSTLYIDNLSFDGLITEVSNTTNKNQNTFYLSQNFPNPFNPSTKIKYLIAKQSKVTLKVFDILGIELVILVDQEQPSGYYEVKFDGTELAGGLYFYRLKADKFVETRKMILLK